MIMKTLIKKKEETASILTRELMEIVKKDISFDGELVDFDGEWLINYKPELYEKLIDDPTKTISIIEKAIANYFAMDSVQLRLINFKNNKIISKIRVSDLNKLFSIKGVIKRTTKIIPRTTVIRFECPSCATIITTKQDKKKIIEPKKCSCGRQGFFKQIGEDIIDIQELNLEEEIGDIQGRHPQQLRAYLEGNLTEEDMSGKLRPGRKAELIGIIKKMPTFMTQKDEDSNLSEFILDVKNVITLEEDDDESITDEDVERIKEIAYSNPLDRLSESLVPEVFGNKEVKEAIVLQLVKGVPRERSDGTYSREDIHILLSGDPGVAKSVTLKSAMAKSPRSRMVVGTKSSKVGLTAMAVKDEISSSWSLEAGVLVLSNDSVVAIDELDKMSDEGLSELLEPMSAGTVTIAKAGISAKLPARTSILASSNPYQGNFNMNEPLAKQIKIPSPILNRFDLIFILLDKPNEELDSKSIEHVFNSFKEKKEPEIDSILFKKYVSFCRKKRPTLDDNLLDELKEFYTKVRKLSSSEKERALPINLRNMEGLIRLSEAHAKLRLSKIVEKEDLEVAKRIFMFCLSQVGMDNETGMIDTSRISEKVPISKRGKMQSLLDLIESLSEKHGKILPMDLVFEEAQKLDIKKWEQNTFIEQLKKENQIYSPSVGKISLQ